MTPPQSSPSQREHNYNNKGVGVNMPDFLNAMGLSTGVTVREVDVHYMHPARQLHADKHDRGVSGMTSEEAT